MILKPEYMLCCFMISVLVYRTQAWNRRHNTFKRTIIKPKARVTTILHCILTNLVAEETNPFQPRVIGGRPAKFGEAPYHLRLVKNKRFSCGAALANHRGLKFAITAGHCLWQGSNNITHIEVSTFPPKNFEIVGADLDKDKWNTREQTFTATFAMIHPDYDPKWGEHDIGLLFLHKYAFESLGLSHIPLPKSADYKDPVFVTLTGHGGKLRTVANRYLQIAEFQTVEHDNCQEYLRWQGKWMNLNPKLLYKQMCYQHPTNWTHEATCSGDSGGPAIAYNYTTENWYLAGIHSWSSLQQCGHPDAVSIATKVSPYVPWIIQSAAKYLAEHGTGNPYTNGTPENV